MKNGDGKLCADRGNPGNSVTPPLGRGNQAHPLRQAASLAVTTEALDARIAKGEAALAPIGALLRLGAYDWSTEDWRAFFDKRAGIAEFDGGRPQGDAETRAFACCLAEWLNHSPARSQLGRCLGCGGVDRPGNPLLPFGTETSGHAWLHSACWQSRYRARKDEGIAALAAMRIRTIPEFPNDLGKNERI